MHRFILRLSCDRNKVIHSIFVPFLKFHGLADLTLAPRQRGTSRKKKDKYFLLSNVVKKMFEDVNQLDHVETTDLSTRTYLCL